MWYNVPVVEVIEVVDNGVISIRRGDKYSNGQGITVLVIGIAEDMTENGTGCGKVVVYTIDGCGSDLHYRPINNFIRNFDVR
jgi:hypothetical protein